MAQTLGESREALALDVWKMAEEFANDMKHVTEPYYIVYHAKHDKNKPGVIRQAIKAYFKRPNLMIGLLVWYVDNQNGIFSFVPELSSPPDIPVDPKLLSDKAEDALPTVMAQGKKLGVIWS